MTAPNMEDLLAIHLAELGLYFERQYKYAKGRKFKADFAVWQKGVSGGGATDTFVTGPYYTRTFQARQLCLIEVQGGIYSKQAHGSVSGVLKDNERLYHAFLNGWHMIRVTPQEVESGEAKAMIAGAAKGS